MKNRVESDIIYSYIFAFKKAEFGKIIIACGGEEILSKEIILKIKEAEAEAQKIRDEAAYEAAQRIRHAQTEGKALCENAQSNAEKINRSKLDIASERADAVLEGARNSALEEAQRAREAAEFNIREAVRLIVAGVYEQCQ